MSETEWRLQITVQPPTPPVSKEREALRDRHLLSFFLIHPPRDRAGGLPDALCRRFHLFLYFPPVSLFIRHDLPPYFIKRTDITDDNCSPSRKKKCGDGITETNKINYEKKVRNESEMSGWQVERHVFDARFGVSLNVKEVFLCRIEFQCCFFKLELHWLLPRFTGFDSDSSRKDFASAILITAWFAQGFYAPLATRLARRVLSMVSPSEPFDGRPSGAPSKMGPICSARPLPLNDWFFLFQVTRARPPIGSSKGRFDAVGRD